jgi:hypothetical protein
VVVTERAAPPPFSVGTCDNFESGLSGNWIINPTTGFAGVSAATSQSPVNAMFLNGGVVNVTSTTIDTSDPNFTDLTVWIRRGSDAFSEYPDDGENLVVEYFDSGSSWMALETFSGNGAGGQIFSRSYTLPAAGHHAGLQVRFRMTRGSGTGWDFWHVDDVCFDQEFVPLLNVAKNVVTLSDPINLATNPKAIPGWVAEYRLVVTNQGFGAVDVDTMVISDAIAADASLYVSTASGDPVQFTDGPVASGLNFTYGSDVTYSNEPGGGAPFTYIPILDADGFDLAVTGIRMNPIGAMNAASGTSTPSFTLQYQVRVE